MRISACMGVRGYSVDPRFLLKYQTGFKEGAEAGFAWGAETAMVQTLEILAGQASGTSHMQNEVRPRFKLYSIHARLCRSDFIFIRLAVSLYRG